MMTKKIMLILQILCYLTAIMLVFVNTGFFVVILQFYFMVTSIVIKIVREITSNNLKLILKNQLTFYLAYLLMAFEILFLYKSMIQIFDLSTIIWTMLVVISKSISYSLLMNKNTANNLELIIYSIGQIIHVVMSVKANIEAVKLFDQIGGQDYIKDMVLLVIATVIAQGILVLDLLFRVYEKKQQKQEIKIKEEPIQVELLKT